MRRSTPLLFLFLLSFLLLFLVACAQQAPLKANYHTGSEGIALSFLPETLPADVYEGSTVPLTVRLENKGTYSLNFSQLLFSLRGDSFYVRIIQDELLTETERLSAEEKRLDGKSLDYPKGEFVDLRPYVEFLPIKGLRESPSTQLFANLCYPYKTFLATPLCVDANAFNGNTQRQVCSASTLTLRDQGAPVAITTIENRPTPIRVAEPGGRGFIDVVQPTFVLHLTNVGMGSVLMPAPGSVEAQAEACALRIPSELLSTVRVNATLSGLPLVCDPNPVPLFNDEGFTHCLLPASEQLSLDTPNYLGLFTAELDYLYRDTDAVDVNILRRAPGSGAPTYAEQDVDPGYIEGIARCDYCAQNPGDSRCADWPSEVAKDAAFSCVCGYEECLDKYRDGRCLIGQTWCSGGSYCCLPGR